MPSMSAPSEGAADVVVGHYDGVSGVRRRPALIAENASFRLVEIDRSEGPFAFADLVGHGHLEGHARFGIKARPGWRIDVPLPIEPALAAHLPGEARYGRLIDRVGLWQGALVCAVIAALVIYGLSRAPTLAAKMMPRSVETAIGNTMVGDFGNRTCSAPAGRAALATMVSRLGPAANIADVRVVNVPIVNAVTLPGGHVLVFDGLVKSARSPDEVAGVIAHELGHVANRDVLASLIRQLGLSVVLGGLGGDVGGWVNTLLSAGYSRSAEGEADGYAIAMLRDARIAPAGVAEFFGRLARGEPGSKRAQTFVGYISTHPLSGERRRRFVASGAGRQGDTPTLTAAEWQALRRICTDDRDVSKTEFRF